MIQMGQHPIENIQWIDADRLVANDWNPNLVLAPEMKLLKLSLLKQGWIQPVLVNREGDSYEVIDGFHRSTLAKTDRQVAAMSGGKVPCAVLSLSKAERMMLTVRINRAKGSHIAIRMHDLVSTLVKELGVSIEEVCEGIGASRHEVETLLMENVFQKFDSANHVYSKAWTPA